MNIQNIINLIENAAPKELAYPWDNVGLLIGGTDKEVKKIFLTLDIDLHTVNEAIDNGCDMIISHHPIMFGGIKKIDFDTPQGKMIKLIIQNDIAVYAAHTNMDAAQTGINAVLAQMFELSDVKVLEEDMETGIGRYGNLKNEISFENLCQLTKKVLNTPCVRASGDMLTKINTIAVASGSCGDYIENAINAGCDAIITGDLKYHEVIDGTEKGICIIDAGHYPTEVIVKNIFAQLLENTDTELVYSQQSDIFKFV